MVKNATRKDGRVKSAVYLGNGKYKYVYASSNRELERKVQEVKLKLGKGVDVSAERDTFGEWAERWLKLKKLDISAKRFAAYQYNVKHFDSISHMPINKIRTADIQDIISEAAVNGAAKQTLSQYKSVCRQIIQLAVDNRVLDYNPAIAVKIPKQAAKTTKRALTEQEQEWILSPTDHRGQRAAMIMMFAGLRRGELIPLLWTDIDLENKTITVNKSVEMINSRPEVKNSTKTASGMRVVHIPQLLADYLATQDKNNSFLVCPNAHGTMYTETAWKRMWQSYISELNFKFGDFSGVMVTDKNGQLTEFKLPASRFAPQKIPMVIPPITAHWLRHTYITMLYLAGVDVMTAKEQAGHADIKTTMQIYTHLDNEYKSVQIGKLDEYLNNKNSPDVGQMWVNKK
ncbi:MAG: site-specific integrase [Ruminococcus sp.]|nr:site-specific integrase [Ruminococcus sp.]MCM1380290.1 site-specific integrase [Muribaculaceae bacterium]MCM1478270.1 site-specific integrase [Muribaculaceae bacterium]